MSESTGLGFDPDQKLIEWSIDEIIRIYTKAVGVDTATYLEAVTHLEAVIFNARTDARTEKILREKAERERDEARKENRVRARTSKHALDGWTKCQDERDALEAALRSIYRNAPMGGHAYHTARKALATLEEA